MTSNEWIWLRRRSSGRQNKRVRRAVASRRRVSPDKPILDFDNVRVLAATDFVNHLKKYLPDPHHQALLDIPRMRLTINNDRVFSLDMLLEKISHSQAAILEILCNQAVLGQSYELAVELLSSVPDDSEEAIVVCENSPPHAAHVSIQCADQSTERGVKNVAQVLTVTKRMQGGRVDKGGFRRLCTVHLDVHVDLLWDDEGAIISARIEQD